MCLSLFPLVFNSLFLLFCWRFLFIYVTNFDHLALLFFSRHNWVRRGFKLHFLRIIIKNHESNILFQYIQERILMRYNSIFILLHQPHSCYVSWTLLPDIQYHLGRLLKHRLLGHIPGSANLQQAWVGGWELVFVWVSRWYQCSLPQPHPFRVFEEAACPGQCPWREDSMSSNEDVLFSWTYSCLRSTRGS